MPEKRDAPFYDLRWITIMGINESVEKVQRIAQQSKDDIREFWALVSPRANRSAVSPLEHAFRYGAGTLGMDGRNINDAAICWRLIAEYPTEAIITSAVFYYQDMFPSKVVEIIQHCSQPQDFPTQRFVADTKAALTDFSAVREYSEPYGRINQLVNPVIFLMHYPNYLEKTIMELQNKEVENSWERVYQNALSAALRKLLNLESEG